MAGLVRPACLPCCRAYRKILLGHELTNLQMIDAGAGTGRLKGDHSPSVDGPGVEIAGNLGIKRDEMGRFVSERPRRLILNLGGV